MKIGNYINPFLLLPTAFLFLVWIYSWGWSNLLPVLTFPIYLFIGFFSFTFLFVGFYLKNRKFIRYSPLSEEHIKKDRPFRIIFFLILLFILDVRYSGVIPIFAGDIEEYEDFGMPIVDPLILALIIFYSIYWFHVFISTKKKIYIVFIIFNFLLCILMARRSALVYIFISFLLMYIQKIKTVRITSMFIIVLLVLGFSFSFGYMGNAKAGLENDYVTTYMGANETFEKAGVSNEHYITYLYICSPLGNFQLTLQKNDYQHSLGELVLAEYVPDYISYKIVKFFDIKMKGRSMEKVIDVLNVGTYFSGGYMYYGWLGVLFHSVFIIFYALIIYFFYPSQNPYHTTINAFLCSLFLMALFANIFRIFINWMVFVFPLLLIFLNRFKKTKIKLK